MTNDELILGLWNDLKAAEKVAAENGIPWSKVSVKRKIDEPYPKHLIIVARAHQNADRTRCYYIEVMTKYEGRHLVRSHTTDRRKPGFKRCAETVLEALSKFPADKIPHRPSRAKYRKGGFIRSLDELAAQEYVYWVDKITPMGWFQNWNLRMAKNALDGGIIRYAVKKEADDERRTD